METIILTAITGIATGILIGYFLGYGDGKKENRSQRIKDYNAGYISAALNTDRTAEEYLNEEK